MSRLKLVVLDSSHGRWLQPGARSSCSESCRLGPKTRSALLARQEVNAARQKISESVAALADARLNAQDRRWRPPRRVMKQVSLQQKAMQVLLLPTMRNDRSLHRLPRLVNWKIGITFPFFYIFYHSGPGRSAEVQKFLQNMCFLWLAGSF